MDDPRYDSAYACPACKKPMVWEPAADNGEAEAGWMFDCNCLDEFDPSATLKDST